MVDATCIFFSRPGEPISEVFRRARRIYEKFNKPHEWTLDYQGSLIGYSQRESAADSRQQPHRPARHGHLLESQCGSARSEDTVVIDLRGYEVVTGAQDWPQARRLRQGLQDDQARHPGTVTTRLGSLEPRCKPGRTPRFRGARNARIR